MRRHWSTIALVALALIVIGSAVGTAITAHGLADTNGRIRHQAAAGAAAQKRSCQLLSLAVAEQEFFIRHRIIRAKDLNVYLSTARRVCGNAPVDAALRLSPR